MALTMTDPLSSLITENGRINIKTLAQAIDLTVPKIALALGKSARFLNEHPTAPSVQPRALQLIDRINSLAYLFGGLRFAIAWLKTPTPELGNCSTMDLITAGDDRSFEVALDFIDRRVRLTPD
jgi:hypothetical protein